MERLRAAAGEEDDEGLEVGQAFIVALQIGDECADYLDPRGVWDLADVQFFVAEFVRGCP